MDDALPWQRLMEIAYGRLAISPDVFWRMSPPEWMAAVRGWREAHGMAVAPAPLPPTFEELEELMARFPDVIA